MRRGWPNRLLLFACVLVQVGCWSTRPPEPGDRDRVLRVDHLVDFGLELPDGALDYEVLQREVWFDGSVMVEYEFEAPEAMGLPYVYSLVERHPSASDACLSFDAGNLGATLAGAEIVDRNEVFQYGDKSRFGLFVVEGQPYGMLYAMCRDKIAFAVLLGGFYVDDPENARALLLPVLRGLETLR